MTDWLKLNHLLIRLVFTLKEGPTMRKEQRS